MIKRIFVLKSISSRIILQNIVSAKKRNSSSIYNTIMRKKFQTKTKEVFINNYRIIKVIGEGSFSEVKLCEDT